MELLKLVCVAGGFIAAAIISLLISWKWGDIKRVREKEEEENK